MLKVTKLSDILEKNITVVECFNPCIQLSSSNTRSALTRAQHPTRHRDHLIGRACAKLAISKGQLGSYNAEIPQGKFGQPRWPENVVGSISHSCGNYVAIVAEESKYASLGVDVEPLSRITWENTIRTYENGNDDTKGDLEKFLAEFSAKESVYKALCHLTNTRIDLSQIEINLDVGCASFEFDLVDWWQPLKSNYVFEGKILLSDGLVRSATIVKPKQTRAQRSRTAKHAQSFQPKNSPTISKQDSQNKSLH